MASTSRTDVDICNEALQELGEDIDGIDSLNASGTKEEKACARIYEKTRDRLMKKHPWNFTKRSVSVEQNDNSRHTLLQSAGGWTVSGVATEYYLPLANAKSFRGKPDAVYEDGTAMTEGTVGTLSAGEWAWDDNDSLDRPTIYVRLSDSTDPDTKFAADNDYLEGEYDTPPFEWAYALPYPADTLQVWYIDLNISAAKQSVAYNNRQSLLLTATREASWEVANYRLLYDSNEADIVYAARVTDPELFDELFDQALVYELAQKLAIILTSNRALKAGMVAQRDEATREARKYNAIEKNVRRERTLTTQRPTTAWAGKGR